MILCYERNKRLIPLVVQPEKSWCKLGEHHRTSYYYNLEGRSSYRKLAPTILTEWEE